MNLIDRLIRFHIHASIWWLVAFLSIIAAITWRYWGTTLLIPLYSGAAFAFASPWPFRRRAALRYAFYKGLLVNFGIVVVAVMVGLHLIGRSTWSTFIFLYYVSFIEGFSFWIVTDDAYDMVNWLSHPLEYGRPPDDIRLLAERREQGTLNRLWRYRYGDEWDVGITGVTTFAFEDGHCNTMSADETFDEYHRWHETIVEAGTES